MIHIPPEVHIHSTIRTGVVYYFVEDSFNSTKPHYFILINKTPLTDPFLVLVNTTSNVDGAKTRRKKIPNTLVEIANSDYDELTCGSIIDCNSLTIKDVSDLVEMLRIPGQSDQSFRSNPTTYSGPFRPLIPI